MVLNPLAQNGRCILGAAAIFRPSYVRTTSTTGPTGLKRPVWH